MAAIWSTQSATREYQMAANGELTVVERLASLLETGQFSDVTIRCGSGDDIATFKAHRLLLATASTPLQKLMASNEGSSTVHFRDVEPDAFQHFLKFIYTDNVQISDVREAFSLLGMSKNWCLNKLEERIIKYLDSFLETYEPSSEEKKNQLCDLIILTEERELLELNEKCWETLIINVNKVVPCQGFLNMTLGHVRKLLSNENFIYKNHLVLFEAIRDWGMNQVLLRHLKVNQLQEVIGSLLQYVNFKSIEDGDFLNTILPSDCLGKGDLIAFFMAKGLEIPRDLAVGQEGPEPDNNYDKTRRFKRGYKLDDTEIYKEHELRFRVDKKLRLLGVGFGFLFSNTDMGITVHCQGPWETKQWTDITQTYCRVTWEKMKTADVRLMFNEAVTIEANQCYKILVRISRMSAGTTSVDLWGGTQGTPSLKTESAEFCFLKSAVPPNQDVVDEDKDNTPGMVTDLFYQLWDKTDIESTSMNGLDYTSGSTVHREITPPRPLSIHRSQKKSDALAPRKMSSEKIEAFIANSSNISPPISPTHKPYGIVKKLEINKIEERLNTNQPPWMNRKSETNVNTYSRPSMYSAASSSDKIPSYLRSKQASTDRNHFAWQIPSKSKPEITKTDQAKSREPSVNREQSQSRFGSNINSSRYGATRYGSGSTSNIDTSSRYGSGITSSRYGSGITSSRYGSGTTSSRYGSGTTSNTDTSSRYGSGTTSNTDTSSRYGSGTTSNTDTSSKYGSGTTSNADTSSRYGSGTSSRYGSGTTSNTDTSSKYGSSLPSSRYASGYSNRYGSGGTDSSKSTYGGYSATTQDSNQPTSKYGSSTNTSSGISAATSRYGSKPTENIEPTSKYGSSSRYGLSSRLGNDNSSSSTSSPSSRFGTSSTSDYSSAKATNATQNGIDPSPTSKLSSDTSDTNSKYRPYSSSSYKSRFASTASPSSSTPTTKTREPTPTRQFSGLSRFGSTSSSLGNSYSSRFGSSYYRR